MTDAMRDAFEAWATSMGYGIIRDANVYCGNLTEFSWEAWQAAIEQGKRQPLTVAQIREVWDAQLFHVTDLAMAIHFANDIQTALGITATPQGKI